jgi:hypothetical protein
MRNPFTNLDVVIHFYATVFTPFYAFELPFGYYAALSTFWKRRSLSHMKTPQVKSLCRKPEHPYEYKEDSSLSLCSP